MSVDISQIIAIIMPVLAFLGQPIKDAIIARSLDKIIGAINKRFDKAHKDRAIFEKWEKNPNDLQLQSELMDTLRAMLRSDPEFLVELAGLVTELSGKGMLPQTQPVPPPVALHQLPADITDFTGREQEVTDLLEGAQKQGTAPPILVVTGIGGSGKSALAIHAAHLLREQFPDVQLYVDLQGAGSSPKHPTNVLLGFLRALGVDDRAIPADQEGRGGLYRSLLSGKRAIILLDNARDDAQVRPLLPADPNCVTLVTSRWSLNALAGNTVDIKLKMLTEKDALSLLERLVGRERVTAESEAAHHILQLCGRLPLAVRIAGGQIRNSHSLSQYETSLDDKRKRLEILKLSDLDIRTCFMLSYQALGPDEARLFRLLSLLPGENIPREAAMALAGGEKNDAWKLINRLVDGQLLELIGDEHYGFHDLVRLFAQECLEQEKPGEQKAARLLLARSYVQLTRTKNDWLTPEKRAEKIDKLVERTGKTYDELSRQEELKALAWFEMERPNLLAAVEWAHDGRDWETTWLLAENLANFYNIRCHWAEWEHTHVLALEATRKGHDTRHEGVILNSLGNVYRLQGYWNKAVSLFEKALKLHRKHGNPTGESIALNLLANVYRLQGRWEEAIAFFKEVLEINIRSGNRYGESIALGGLGNVYRMQGRWDDALKEYEKSLKISVERHDKRGECISLNNMGLVYSRQGNLDEAETVLKKSQHISIEFKLPKGDCIVLRTLGEVRMLEGRLDEAKDLLKQSLEIAKRQGDRRCTSQTLNSLGVLHTKQGNWVEADNCFDEALLILHEMGDRHGEGLVLKNKGELFAVQDHIGEAVNLWQEALEELHSSSPEYNEVAERLNHKQLEHSPMLGV